MDATAAGIVAGVVSGIGGAAVTGFVTVLLVRRNLAAGYDSDLRAKRLEQYATLWPLFRDVAATRPEPLTRAETATLGNALRTWYFDGGGLFMSRASVDFYNLLQRAIRELTAVDRRAEMSSDEQEAVRFLASSLRTRLTDDVATRRPPMLARRRDHYVVKWRARKARKRFGLQLGASRPEERPELAPQTDF